MKQNIYDKTPNTLQKWEKMLIEYREEMKNCQIEVTCIRGCRCQSFYADNAVCGITYARMIHEQLKAKYFDQMAPGETLNLKLRYKRRPIVLCYRKMTTADLAPCAV